VERLFEEARASFKLATPAGYQAARVKLEKCLKVDKTFPDCHKLLGATLGQLGDGPNGAKEYELFLKYAPPDHPSVEKVKHLLEEYHKSAR
jgi:hypothetical protein